MNLKRLWQQRKRSGNVQRWRNPRRRKGSIATTTTTTTTGAMGLRNGVKETENMADIETKAERRTEAIDPPVTTIRTRTDIATSVLAARRTTTDAMIIIDTGTGTGIEGSLTNGKRRMQKTRNTSRRMIRKRTFPSPMKRSRSRNNRWSGIRG